MPRRKELPPEKKLAAEVELATENIVEFLIGPPACTVGQRVDYLYDLRAMRQAMSKVVDELKALESYTEGTIREELLATGMRRGGGHVANISFTPEKVPVVDDWNKVFAFIKKENDFSLLQKRLTVGTVKEYWGEGIKIPGTRTETVMKMSLTKRGAK